MPATAKKKLKIGDLVNVALGNTRWRARLIEDRGPIGVNRRRLFRVQLLDTESEPLLIEVPEDDIEPAQR